MNQLSHLKSKMPDTLHLYGRHALKHAFLNPHRHIRHIFADESKQETLADWLKQAMANHPNPPPVSWISGKGLTRRVGQDAVHQGLVADVRPLSTPPLETFATQLAERSCILVLDQVTDPHNVGAILRSAAVFGADALITSWRHSPGETGLLARVASGALDIVPWIRVRNLADSLLSLHTLGFESWGLASEATKYISDMKRPNKLALVLGSEGKGMRLKSRETVTNLVKLPTAGGAINDHNVSNATAIALYETMWRQ